MNANKSTARKLKSIRSVVLFLLAVAGLTLLGGPLGPHGAEAAVSMRAISALATATTGNITVAAPGGTGANRIVANDILILVVTTRNTTAVTLPSGFTQIQATNTSTSNMRMTSAWKRAVNPADTQGTSYVVTHTGTVSKTAYMASFSGVITTGSPINVSSTLASGASNTVTGTATSPTVAGTMLLFSGSQAYAGKTFNIGTANNTNPAYTDTTVTPPSGGPGRAITGTMGTTANGVTTFMYFGSKTNTGTTNNRTATTTGTTARGLGQLIALTPDPAASTLTLATGTDPAATTVGPGVTTTVDSFTVQVDAGTDTITTLPVVLSGSGSSLASISIWNSTNTVQYYTTINTPTDGTVNFTGGTGIPVTASAVSFNVRMTTKTAVAMPAPQDQTYGITAYVDRAGIVATAGTKLGSDSSNTITVDNQSPNNPGSFAGAPDSTHITLTWTDPTGPTFNNTMIIRNQWYCALSTTTDCITDNDCGGSGPCVKTPPVEFDSTIPTEGLTYIAGNTVGSGIGRGKVIYSYDGSPTPGTYDDTSLFNGIGYSYKIFARDSYNNYSTGVKIGPIVPMSPCVRVAPTVILAPDKQTITTDGGFVQYAVSITNNDSNCTDSTFNIAVTYNEDPASFSTSLDRSSVTLASGGGSVNAYMTVTAALGLKSGNTHTHVTVTDSPNHSDVTTADVLTTIARLSPKLHNSLNTGADPAGGVISNKWVAYGGWGIAGAKYGEFDCNTCHKPGTGNIKNIKDYITAPDPANGQFPGEISGNPVIVRSVKRMYDFYNMGWDSDAHTTSQRVCEYCHSQNKFHNYNATWNSGNGGTLDHNNDEDCMKCHSHDTAFNALSRPCTDCHGYPPPPLAFFGENVPTKSPTVGQHAEHINNLVILGGGKVEGFTTTARTFTACNTCHYNATATKYNDNHNVTMGFWIYKGKGMDGEGFRGGVYDGWTSVSYDSSDPWTTGNPYYTTVMNTASNPADYTMKCSNVYCHGGTMPDNGGEATFALWAQQASTQCKTCHGATSDDPPRRGEHERHTSYLYNNQPCKDCHNGYWWGTTIPSNTPTHVDGEINFGWDTGQSYISNSAVYTPGPDDAARGKVAIVAGTPGNSLLQPNKVPYVKTYGTCSSLGNCHPGGSPVWGTGSLTASCDTCHASNGAGTWPTHNYTGSHGGSAGGKHVSKYLLACEQCHAKFNSSNRTSHAKGFVNPNQAAEVKFTNLTGSAKYNTARDNPANADTLVYRDVFTNPYGWLSMSMTPTYAGGASAAGSDPIDPNFKYTSGQCSNIWCHSNANPLSSWNTIRTVSWQSSNNAGGLGCNGCHSAQADAAAGRTWSTAHNRHTNTYSFTCSYCHNSVVTAGGVTTINNYSNHANGVKNVVFSSAAGSGGLYTSPACENTYCHSDGTSLSSGLAPTHLDVNWDIGGGAPGTDCDACHGGISGNGSGRPVYGEPWASINPGNKANEHYSTDDSVKRHLALACQDCHYASVRTTWDTVGSQWNISSIWFTGNGSNHANGAYNIQGAPGNIWSSINYTYQTDGGTCIVYCHSNVQSANGTAGPSVYTLAKWGSSGTADCNTTCHLGNNMTSGGHLNHLSRMGGVGCDQCHANGGSGTDQHANGVIKVNMSLGGSYTQDGTSPGSNGYGQCSNIACHGSTAIGNPTWGGAVGCQDCHMTTGPDVDDFWATFWGNGTVSMRNQGQWLTSGHGRTSGTYASGNPAANFVDWGSNGGPSYASACEYCHDKTAGHRDTADMNNLFRLKNISDGLWNTWGLNGNCQACHATGASGVDIGLGVKTATRTIDSTHYDLKHSDSGTATAGGSATLTDSSKTWQTSQWNFALVSITGGRGVGQSKMISTNLPTVLTVASSWVTSPDATSLYSIVKGNYADSGTATAGGASSVTDGSKAWAANQWQNASVLITSGMGESQSRTILSNSGTVLTVGSAWSTTPDATSDYAILFGNGGKFCWDCHDPHGDTNAYMIHNQVAKTTDLNTSVPIVTVPATFTAWGSGVNYAQNWTTSSGICNVCHSATKHYTATSGDSHNSDKRCTTCHTHTSAGSTKAAFKPLLICNSCHDYDTELGGTYWGQLPQAVEGYGAHAKHIEHLKVRNTATLDPNNDTYGVGAFNQVCGVCHNQNSSNHTMDGTSLRVIDFNGSTTYQFGSSWPTYNGWVSVSSAVRPKTCSNVSCHYSNTPVWSGY